MTKSRWLSGAALGVVAVGAMAPQITGAQEQKQAASFLEEIVITARKTEESLQEAPISVTAFTAEQLRERGIGDVDDVARFTPGLSFSQAFGRSSDRPVIRGNSNVLANVQFGVESGTAYFVDGIYYPTTIQSLDFNLIERVEVIKGPQSALYGRNTYAGAINFVTIDPSEEFRATIRGHAAEGDEYEISGTVGGPIVPGVLGAVISARSYEYGGQYRNEITGDKVGQEESWNINSVVSFTPSSNFNAKLRLGYQRDNDGPLALFLQGSAENNCLPGFRSNRYRAGGTLNATPGGQNTNQYFCGVIKPAPVRLNTDPGLNGEPDGTAFDGIEREIFTLGFIAQWEISDQITITSQTGYRDETEKFGTDSDHSDANLIFGPPGQTEALFANTNRDDIEDWSQEIRLEWAPSDRLRFLVGGFYYDQEIEGRDITFQSGEEGVPFGTNGTDRSTVENIAVFGLAEIGLTDRLSVTGEVRWMEETKSLLQFGAGDVIVFDEENTEDYVTPRVTVDYQAAEDLLLYFVYAEGVKPGGFNGVNGLSVNATTYGPETADSFEAGFKSSFLDGRLIANVSGYYIDATDVQLTTAIPPMMGGGAVTSVATNQGQGEVLGAEIELFFTPNENWSFTAGYAWTRPEFTAGCDADQFILLSGGLAFDGTPSPECDISGNRYPLTSEHQANFSATYTRPISDGLELFITSDATYESSKFVQVHNRAKTGDAFLLGAKIGVRGERWQVNVFGRNLTDEDSIVLATRWFDLRYGFGPNVPAILADGGALGGPGAVSFGLPRGFFGTLRRPRQVGIEFSYNF
ncbi:MAG: TonB-dependent receptor [Alphaproteobacteria bacterium]|nr:MAG: TonB-dependent receptor [Alphaproteobacteria bacterium]